MATIQKLEEEAIQATESFRIELDSSNRLAELQGSAAQMAKQRAQECQVILEKAKHDAAQEISRLRVELETETSEKKTAEARIAELEEVIAQIESETTRSRSASPARSLNGAGPSTPMRSSTMRFGTPGSTFSPRASRGKGGLTVTQMYSEYDKMRAALAAAERNNQEYRTTIDEMVLEMESTSPDIAQKNEEINRLNQAVVDMSTLNDIANKERDNSLKEARKWQGQVNGLVRDGDILRRQLRDLGSEVKVLLLEVALLQKGEEYDREELERIARGHVEESDADLNATGRFISQNLTTFKNLHELQAQNVKLRQMLRDLGDRLEGEEAREKEAARLNEIDELKELRVRAQTNSDEIANLTAQMQSYVKERDTFRSMLMHKKQNMTEQSVFSQSMPLGASPGGELLGQDNAEMLSKVQAQFDTYREETNTEHTKLRQQVNELAHEKSKLMSEITRLNGAITASSRREELLRNETNMHQSEKAMLQERNSQLSENAVRQGNQIREAAENLIVADSKQEELQKQCMQLKAEKDRLEMAEKRYKDEVENLWNQKDALQSSNTELQVHIAELKQTEQRYEALEDKLKQAELNLKNNDEEWKRQTLRRDYDHEQSQKQINELMTSLSSVREQLVATKTTRDHLQARVNELTVELKSAEERARSLPLQPSVTASVTEPAVVVQESGEGNDMTPEEELSLEVSKLKRELELTKSELDHANQLAQDYQAISQDTEERLESVTETQEQYRQETDAIIKEKDEMIQSLKTRIDEISAELVNANSEISQLKEKQSESTRHLEEREAQFESEISRLNQIIESHVAAAQCHEEDMKAQAEISDLAQRNYDQAQQKYEKEFLERVAATENLQSVRHEVNELKLQIVKLEQQTEAYKKDLGEKEEIWTEHQEKLKVDINELKTRREELQKENEHLYTLIENHKSQNLALRRRAEGSGEMLEGDQVASSTQAEEDIIASLRNRLQIVETESDLTACAKARLEKELRGVNSKFLALQSSSEAARQDLENIRREAESQAQEANAKRQRSIDELKASCDKTTLLFQDQLKEKENTLQQKSAQVVELSTQIARHESRICELQDEVEAKDRELQLLQESHDHYAKLAKNNSNDEMEKTLAALEEAKNTAVSERDQLQAQIAEAEAAWNTRRDDLIKQAKDRSKKQTAKLNTVLEEKDVISKELQITKNELENLKAKAPVTSPAPTPAEAATPAAAAVNPTPASQFPTATVSVAVSGDDQRVPALEQKIQSLEQKIQRLEAALAEKEREHDIKIQEYIAQLAEVRAAHRQEVEKLSAGGQSVPGTAGGVPGQAPATPSEPVESPEITYEQLTKRLDKASEAEAKDICKNRAPIRDVIVVFTRKKLAMNDEEHKQKASLVASENQQRLEQKDEEYQQQLKKKDNEIKLAGQKPLVKISMLEKRLSNANAKSTDLDAELVATKTTLNHANAKIEVVEKAATETPEKPVAQVWEDAQKVQPAPAADLAVPTISSAQPPSPASTPVQQAPAAAPSAAPAVQTPPTAQVAPTPTPTSAQGQTQPTLNTPAQFGQSHPEQNQQPSNLPNKPPAGNPPGLMRALQSGLPIARGGRGGRGGGQQYGHAQQNDQQGQNQAQVQRGGGAQRGRGGRGGQGRGGNQNANAQSQSQSQPQTANANRGNLNASARQFIPQGNKRSRDEGSDNTNEAANAGKRQRGGGGQQPRGGGSS
jgi:nucleoprotein TPR